MCVFCCFLNFYLFCVCVCVVRLVRRCDREVQGKKKFVRCELDGTGEII